ncbi:Response regulator receiver protein [Rhodospirillaceae bacterium LM-1]|nr:Response regulator receiver protein [Rhodospirillaceae bacterium LM-1]
MFNILSAEYCMVLDPNPHYQRLVREILRFGGPKNLEIEFAVDVDHGLRLLCERSMHFIVMETTLPLKVSLDFLMKIRKGRSKWNFDISLPIIGYADAFTPQEIYRLRDAGISELMIRPLSAATFFKCLRSASSRKFIETSGYCGPDRRRRLVLNYANKRRADDKAAELAEAAKAEAARKQAEADAEAALQATARAEQEKARKQEAQAEAARKKAEAEAEAEAARKKAEAEAEAARKKAEAEAASAKVDLSAMTQEELARHLRSQKK